MKHLGKIQSEFLKEATKWDDLSYDAQKDYLDRHKKSKKRVTAKPGQDGAAKSNDAVIDSPRAAMSNAMKSLESDGFTINKNNAYKKSKDGIYHVLNFQKSNDHPGAFYINHVIVDPVVFKNDSNKWNKQEFKESELKYPSQGRVCYGRIDPRKNPNQKDNPKARFGAYVFSDDAKENKSMYNNMMEDVKKESDFFNKHDSRQSLVNYFEKNPKDDRQNSATINKLKSAINSKDNSSQNDSSKSDKIKNPVDKEERKAQIVNTTVEFGDAFDVLKDA